MKPPPIGGDVRLATRQIVSMLFAFLFIIITGVSNILMYVCCNSAVRANYSVSPRPLEGAHLPAINWHSTMPVSYLITIHRTIWTTQETTLLEIPGIGPVLARVGSHFPLMLRGHSVWMTGIPWYPVQWSTSASATVGWVSAAAVTFAAPEKIRARSSLDILAPRVITDLVPPGSDVGVAVYDVTHQRRYTYQGRRQFLCASSIKVPVMLAFLDLVERQKREPNSQEMAQLTAMIEYSDNDAASALYFNELGGAAGLTNFLKQHRITGLVPDANSWGYSQITPLAMVDLLTLLQEGKILTARHRALALSLMEHVEADQRAGVGDTAPAGAVVAMKNGWVPGPDALWAVNTSGIIMGKNETYIIAVFTQKQPSLAAGQAITQKICRAIASLFSL